jgi:nitrite reductase/ring-hydroxylating ferredoxin subunit
MNQNITQPSALTRRHWVKQFVLGSAASLVGGSCISRVLAEVTTTGPGLGVLRIKPASFPALANAGGSIQLQFIEGFNPLTLNRINADRFIALNSTCSHAGCSVARFIVGNNRMQCPCHGSRYDIEGRVFRDAFGNSTEPAPDDLERYTTQYDQASGLISISLPNLALHIKSISVQQQGLGGSMRLKLLFPVSFGATYEIRHQADLSSPFNLISFATTPTGPANRTSVGPENEGNFTAYVDAVGSRGFFVVGVRLTEVL